MSKGFEGIVEGVSKGLSKGLTCGSKGSKGFFYIHTYKKKQQHLFLSTDFQGGPNPFDSFEPQVNPFDNPFDNPFEPLRNAFEAVR